MIRRLPLVSAVVASVLVAAGAVAFWRANQAGQPDGTTYTGGYEPLERAGTERYPSVYFFSDGWTVLWTGEHLAGAVLIVVGLLFLAGLAGWLLGRRTGRPRTP